MGFIVFFDFLHNKKYGLSQFCTFCISEFHREVAYYLGLESITLYSILNTQFYDDTFISGVRFVYHRQISSIVLIKYHYCQIICRG